MTHSSPARALVEKYYGLIDSGNLTEATRLMTPDVTLTFANAEPVRGQVAAETSIQAVLDRVTAIKHTVVNWIEEPDSGGATNALFEIRIRYHLKNGKLLELPGAVYTRISGDGSFSEQRLYGDLNDVFAD